MSKPQLTEDEQDRLLMHYTSNCFGCRRCSFYEAIDRGEPGAVAAYVQYMKEAHGETIEVISEDL